MDGAEGTEGCWGVETSQGCNGDGGQHGTEGNGKINYVDLCKCSGVLMVNIIGQLALGI